MYKRIISAFLIPVLLFALLISPVHAGATLAAQTTTLFYDGNGECIEILKCNAVTTADTIDVSAVGAIAFKKVRWAVWGPAGFDGSTGHTTAVVGGVSGTVITFTLTGLSNDSVWLMVSGSR